MPALKVKDVAPLSVLEKLMFAPAAVPPAFVVSNVGVVVIATGPGAVGNHTIGASALGGMLFGTIFGVIIVPGLYYVFGKMAEGRQLIRDEDENPLSEDIVEGRSDESLTKKVREILTKIVKGNGTKNNP